MRITAGARVPVSTNWPENGPDEDKLNFREAQAMKNIALSAILVGGLAAPLCSAQPTIAASVEVFSVYFQPPATGSTRQPRFGTTGQLATIPGSQYTPDPTVTGSSVEVTTNPVRTIVLGTGPTQTTLTLVYVSITGGAGGGITVFPDAGGDMPDFVTVPLQTPPQNISVENVYFPSGGQGGGSGAGIDEFSEDSGQLIEDTFVSVYAPPTSTVPDPARTTSGNQNGFVDTNATPGGAGVRIMALQPPIPFESSTSGGNFHRWITGPGGTISLSDPQDLIVGDSASDYALALYRLPCPEGYQLNQTATITECVQITCPAGQAFNNAYDECLPTCRNGQVYNPTLKKCIAFCPPDEICGICPSSCRYGCFLFQEGQTVGICKPKP
jgi:hypothetical protein